MKNAQKNVMPQLKDLTLMNRFLFSEAVEDQQFFEDLLSIIIGEDILLKGKPQSEKEVRSNSELPLRLLTCSAAIVTCIPFRCSAWRCLVCL